jgi:hypothetical protein
LADEIRITCDACLLDERHFVGVTEFKAEYVVCSCEVCGVLQNRKHIKFMMNKPRPERFRCYRCKEAMEIRAVEHPKGELDEVFDFGKCPNCAGNLLSETTGNVKK